MGVLQNGFRAVRSGHIGGQAAPRPRFDRPRAHATFGLTVPPEITGLVTGGSVAPRISRREALQVPAVMRARNLIAGTLGSLPHTVHGPDRREVNGTYLLGGNVDPDMPNSVVFAQTYEDLLFESIAWWRVTQLAWHGFPLHARHVPVESVHVHATDWTPAEGWVGPDQPIPEDGQVFIDGVRVPDTEIIRFDSPNPPLLTHGARAIRTALKLDKAAALYADEPMPQGVFFPQDGADPDDDEVQEALDKWHAARQANAWGYVNAALKAQPLEWSPEQLQLADARQHAVLEIARLAGLDADYLGVTSGDNDTYANTESRRSDLLAFTLAPYPTAVEDRLSMHDVLPRGYQAKVKFDAFLRSDTKTRMEAYTLGLPVGAYTREEIRVLEDRPALPATQVPAEPAEPAEPSPARSDMASSVGATFTEPGVLAFDLAPADAAFRVDPEKRTISGLAVPWGVVGRSGFTRYRFERGSLMWADTGRVKMLRDHDASLAVGRAIRLDSTEAGLDVTFKIARGSDGDTVLALAEDGILDGLSVGIDFTSDPGDLIADPADPSVLLVRRAHLREVTLTAMPSFDGARVRDVAASRTTEGPTMSDTAVAEGQTAAPAAAPAQATFGTAELTTLVATAVAEAFTRLGIPDPADPQNIRQAVSASRPTVQVVREAPVYLLNGTGHSFVKDAWHAKTERNGPSVDECFARLRKYQEQTAEFAKRATEARFAAETRATLPEVIPPGYRPELYVGQLPQGRPLAESVSRGTLTDATPFTVPRFTTSSGTAAAHVEGTPPAEGDIDVDAVTVTPGGQSGLIKLTREIVDAANPAIDQIALDAMREQYARNTEALVYAELNGANGVGGVITAGFVPSGAQAATSTGGSAAAGTFGGKELLKKLRVQLALYSFRRFSDPSVLHLSQEGTSAFADAEDTTGRPLLPSVGATNTAGIGNAVRRAWDVDGLNAVPSWSMTGNAAGDADVIGLNSRDVYAWESALLTFRFEERGGPTFIELALFGYFATRVLRPVGLFGIRHTVGA